MRFDRNAPRDKTAEGGDAVADKGADIEHEIATPDEAAIELVHRRGARPVAIIDAKRPDNPARGPESFEHHLRPHLAWASPTRSPAIRDRGAQPVFRLPPPASPSRSPPQNYRSPPPR